MNRWQDSLINFIPVLAFTVLIDMLRAILTLGLEKKLNRKLTDWDWQYFLHESHRKAEAESRQEMVRQWRQQLVDRQIIHDFIWGEVRG